MERIDKKWTRTGSGDWQEPADGKLHQSFYRRLTGRVFKGKVKPSSAGWMRATPTSARNAKLDVSGLRGRSDCGHCLKWDSPSFWGRQL